MFGKICVFIVTTAFFFEGATSEVVQLNMCPGESQEWCSVQQVRIDPCKEIPKACTIKKGKSASISFDFTPKFAATRLESKVYWANGFVDLPFMGMDTDACKFTTCPSAVDVPTTYTYQLNLSKKLPSGTYPIKWKIWNVADSSQQCCFMSDIKLKN